MYFYDLLVCDDPIPDINRALLRELQDIFQNRMSFVGDQPSEMARRIINLLYYHSPIMEQISENP
ncbi:hypothetical protein GCM10008915_33300 [Bifidobacterium pullorum subsp. gallinarum]